MVEVIISGKTKNPGIIGEAHRSSEDLGKIFAANDFDLGIGGVEKKRKILEERVAISKTSQDLILDFISSCKR
jgi:hypothetical protein